MTDAIRGDECYIEIDTGGGWVKPAEQTDSTFTPSGSSIAATSKDSNGAQEKIVGYRDWEMSYSAIYDSGDAAYLALEQAHLNENTISVRFFDGTRLRTGTAIVLPGALVSPAEDKVTYDVTLTGTGDYAVTTP